MILIHILLLIIFFLLLLALCLWRYYKARITELEIYGYYAREFITKCGLAEEWGKVVEGIEKDME